MSERSPRDGFDEPQRLLAEDVRTRIVDAESVLLRYFLGNARSYLWTITSDRTTVDALPGRQDLQDRVQRYRDACGLDGAPDAEPAPTGDWEQAERQEAVVLGRLLLGPAAWALDRARVLILADGFLQLLPFAALGDPRLGSRDEILRLVERHELVVLPSASILVVQRGPWQPRRSPSRPVVVFADPVVESADPRLRGLESTAAAAGMDDESGIGPLGAGADVLRGFEANRAAASDAALANYRVVHFAAHGIIDDRHPEQSGVTLSLFDRSGRPQDGHLRLQDICSLWLPVDLVVLGACRTVASRDVPGRGLNELVRAFLAAGTRRVIASLWNANDEATRALMSEFYSGLFERELTPAAALREAQLALLGGRRWARPCDWAAFVLQGEWT